MTFWYALRKVIYITTRQWSFRKTGTMGTLAAKRKLVSWVQNRVRFIIRNDFEIVHAKSCNLVSFWPENCLQWRP